MKITLKQKINGLITVIMFCFLLALFGQTVQAQPQDAQSAIGEIAPTPGIGGDEGYGTLSSPTGEISGPIRLVNVVLATLAVIAGVVLLYNIVMAGISIILGAAKPGKLAEAFKRVVISILGLAIIALAYLIVGVVSETLFGSADFILNPILLTE